MNKRKGIPLPPSHHHPMSGEPIWDENAARTLANLANVNQARLRLCTFYMYIEGWFHARKECMGLVSWAMYEGAIKRKVLRYRVTGLIEHDRVLNKDCDE